MNNIALSIKELCEQFVTPAIERSGWNRELQISYYEDKNFIHARLNTEYVLLFKPNIPLGVISVTENNTKIDTAIEQAIENAKTLDVPCAFSSNGNGFLFHNRTKINNFQTELDLDHFPTPNQLWEIYLNYKNAKSAAEEIIKAVKKKQNRLLLSVAAVGTGLITIVLQIIKECFDAGTNKRALYLTDRDDYWRNWNDCNPLSQSSIDDHRNRIISLNQMPVNRPNGIYLATPHDLYANKDGQNFRQLPPDFFDTVIVDKGQSGNVASAKVWQELLEYFRNTTQIAVTPLYRVIESDIDYFGKPIYIDTAQQVFGNTSFSMHNIQSQETMSNNNTNDNQAIVQNTTTINNSVNIQNTTNNNYFNENNTTINKVLRNKTSINKNKTILKNNVIMARTTSFEVQLELAEELKRYLHGFQERLGAAAQNYRSKSDAIYEAGMMDEAHREFSENYMELTVKKISDLITLINERDIPFVERYISDLEVLRDKHGK